MLFFTIGDGLWRYIRDCVSPSDLYDDVKIQRACTPLDQIKCTKILLKRSDALLLNARPSNTHSILSVGLEVVFDNVDLFEF